jgi:hypothetical protein
MRAEHAAAFCDEVSVDAFLDKVAKGIYSPPKKEPGCPDKWHRAKLEADIARRHGLAPSNGPLVEDLGGLIG